MDDTTTPSMTTNHHRHGGSTVGIDDQPANLERQWSGISSDAGGIFGGDGGVLDRNPSHVSSKGWLERLDTPPKSHLSSGGREQQKRGTQVHSSSDRQNRPYTSPDAGKSGSTQSPPTSLHGRDDGPDGLHGLNEKQIESGERAMQFEPEEDGKRNDLDLEAQKETAADDSESSTVADFAVNWDGDADPENPRAMSNFRKWLCTAIVSASSMCVTCTSSIYTSATTNLMEDFHAARLLVIAGLSLFVIGLGIGPMILAPLSEFYGRRPIYIVSFAFFLIFLVPDAVAPNIGVMLLFRFITGVAGSAFLSVAGGTVGDLFVRRELGAPMMLYTLSPFIGPALGPLVGGFINQYTSWRWTFYALIIWAGVQLLGLYLFVPETYHPVLLRHRAQRLRTETGDERYYAPIERMDKSIVRTILWSCLRPFQLLIWEPMVLLLCTFTAILLGVLYLFFEAFPLVFGKSHNFTPSQIGLTFLGIFVGMILIGIISQPTFGRYWERQVEAAGEPTPEMRLPQAIVGSILVTVGLFWFAWTTYPSVHWIVPIIASACFGMGTLMVFGGVFTFLVDAYPLYAASALAANSFMRSSFAAGFPLFGDVMYNGLGFQWASCLLAFITVPMAPVMWLFYYYGPQLRKKSRFAGGSNK